jgi:hypothetical protein
MEEARTSETSVDNYFTRQYIPEDKSELHSRRRENLKSHIAIHVCAKTLLVHLQQKVGELVLYIASCPSIIIL